MAKVRCGPNKSTCLWYYKCPNHKAEEDRLEKLDMEALEGLLPCPHCDSTFIAISSNRYGYKVACGTCDMHDRHETKVKAARAWNRRK